MTGKDEEAASRREDSFLAELVPQVTEHLAEQRARDFDAELGRARFQAWLGAHTFDPDVTHQTPAPDPWEEPEVPRLGRPFSAHWWRPERWARLILPLRRARYAGMPGIMPLKMPALLDVRERSDTFTIESPAMGDAFTFLIRVRCTWCGLAPVTEEEKEHRTAEVRAFIEENRAITRERVEEKIRPIARQFPPYRASEAEERLNRELADGLDDGDVRVVVRARVDVSDPVREDLQKIWRQRLAADAEVEMKKVAELQADVARIDKSGSSELGKALARISVLESQMAVYWKGVGQSARVQNNDDDNAELEQALLGINQALQAIQGLMKAEYDNKGAGTTS